MRALFVALIATAAGCTHELYLSSAPQISCAGNIECPEAFVCNAYTGLCVDACQSDDDCPDAYVCWEAGYCAQLCISNDHCPDDLSCDPKLGLCLAPASD